VAESSAKKALENRGYLAISPRLFLGKGIPPRGLEPSANIHGKVSISDLGGAKSGAVYSNLEPIDPDLQRLINAWPDLPEAIRVGVLAMVRSAVE
jgi:hypothetical protein